MATTKRIISETYSSVSVFYSITNEASGDSGTFLDADQLTFYDGNVPNSYDIELSLNHVIWSLEGNVTLNLNHTTTDDVHLITLANSGEVNFPRSLGRESVNLGFNGDINYVAGNDTEGYLVATFEKKAGYKNNWKGWRKPTQPR